MFTSMCYACMPTCILLLHATIPARRQENSARMCKSSTGVQIWRRRCLPIRSMTRISSEVSLIHNTSHPSASHPKWLYECPTKYSFLIYLLHLIQNDNMNAFVTPHYESTRVFFQSEKTKGCSVGQQEVCMSGRVVMRSVKTLLCES